MQAGMLQEVSADVKFMSKRFQSNEIFLQDENEDELREVPSAKEVVARETADLLARRARLSVRDLASKFEKGLADAQAASAELSELAKLKDLHPQVLVTKLYDLLQVLGGRVAGRNKDDVDDALNLVDALKVQLAHRDREIEQHKTNIERLECVFQEASDEAGRVVEEAKAAAHLEIEAAIAAAERVQAALDEQERASAALEKQELEHLRLEIQQARRIRMLHEPSKVMDMEFQIEGLRQYLEEKTREIYELRKKLEATGFYEKGGDGSYQIHGAEFLGSCLKLLPLDEIKADLSSCTVQWYRATNNEGKLEIISGATKPEYAPEPYDVGKRLKVDIRLPDGILQSISSHGVISPAPGLAPFVDALAKKGGADFHVVIVQQNGQLMEKQSIYNFHVGRMCLKLHKGRINKVKETYSTAMQLCGCRGGGDAAPLGMYWVVKKGLSYMLAFQSERERNTAIMLARRFAFDSNVMLLGPDDKGAFDL